MMVSNKKLRQQVILWRPDVGEFKNLDGETNEFEINRDFALM